VSSDRSPQDAISLYNKLEQVVMPLFYRNRSSFIDTMRHAIALNGSFFSNPANALAVRLEGLLSLKV
jgi:starch phosphorylase